MLRLNCDNLAYLFQGAGDSGCSEGDRDGASRLDSGAVTIVRFLSASAASTVGGAEECILPTRVVHPLVHLVRRTWTTSSDTRTSMTRRRLHCHTVQGLIGVLDVSLGPLREPAERRSWRQQAQRENCQVAQNSAFRLILRRADSGCRIGHHTKGGYAKWRASGLLRCRADLVA